MAMESPHDAPRRVRAADRGGVLLFLGTQSVCLSCDCLRVLNVCTSMFSLRGIIFTYRSLNFVWDCLLVYFKR